MATAKKKVAPKVKKRAPRKPIQSKEEIEKHLKAVNAALGIAEEETVAAETATEAPTQPAAPASEAAEPAGAHASDLIKMGSAAPAEHETVQPPAFDANQPPASQGEAPANTESPTAEEPAAPEVESATPEQTPATPDAFAATTQPETPAAPVSPETSQTPPATGIPPMPGTEEEDTEPPQSEEGQPSISDYVVTDGESEGSSGKKKAFIFILVFVLTILIAGGGLYLYNMMTQKQAAKQDAEKKQAAEQFQPDPTATPTPEALPLADYSVEVLNGVGTAGVAGEAAALLEEAGFENIETGNADAYDYTETEVAMKANVPESVYEAIEEALSGTYQVTQVAEALSDSSDFDIQVTVGDSEAEETPTPTEAEE